MRYLSHHHLQRVLGETKRSIIKVGDTPLAGIKMKKHSYMTDFSNGSDSGSRRNLFTRSSSCGTNMPSVVAFSSPLQVLLKNLAEQKDVAEERLKQAQFQHISLEQEFSSNADIDYTKPSCSICHFRAGTKQRSHNRANCPTRYLVSLLVFAETSKSIQRKKTG